jgi:hypothetical protein
MSKSKTALRNELKTAILNDLMAHFTAQGEDCQQTATHKFGFPCVDSEGNDEYIVITISVPTGERGEDGDPYDLYGEAEMYRQKQAAKAEKAKESAAKKAAKIAKDKADREAKAKAKAEREAEGK